MRIASCEEWRAGGAFCVVDIVQGLQHSTAEEEHPLN
jgi:hypothetical protein